MARKACVPFIAGLESAECGAACLAMILAKFGHWAPLNEVRDACCVSREGANNKGIEQAALSYGMQVASVLADLDELEKLQVPCILHMDLAHFVVMTGHSKRKVWITDPGLGDLYMDMEAFSNHFTGVAIVMVPGDDFQKRPRATNLFRKLSGFLKGSGPYLLGVIWLTAIVQVFGMGIPFLDRLVIDRLIPGGDRLALLWTAAVALVAFIFIAGTETVRALILREMRTRLDLSMMRTLVDQMFRLPVGYFLQRAQGALAQKVSLVSSIRSTVSEQAVSALFDMATASAFIVVLARYTLPGAGVAILYAGLFCLAQRMLTKRLDALCQSKVAASGAAYNVIMESHHAVETVKSMGAERQVFDRWCGHTIKESLDEIRINNVRTGHQAGMQALGEAFIIAVMGVAGGSLARGAISVGEFAAVLVAARSITQAVASFSGAFQTLGQIGGYMHSLGDVMESTPERTGGMRPERVAGRIQVEGVQFSYGKLMPNTLHGVSLEIEAGEMVGIVGPSGSGKSTLVKLMVSLYTPKEGRILLDGTDLSQIDLGCLRARIGYVLQDSFVFNDTIAFNVSLTDDPDPASLDRACRIAGILDVIQTLPQGYDTVVGEGGRLFSGGQRQRLNLARALYKDPAILLLDEASSALDLETERVVHQALADLKCTRIVIAHRLATVRAADRIIFMEDGRINDQGTFSHLATTNARFRNMCLASGVIGEEA